VEFDAALLLSDGVMALKDVYVPEANSSEHVRSSATAETPAIESRSSVPCYSRSGKQCVRVPGVIDMGLEFNLQTANVLGSFTRDLESPLIAAPESMRLFLQNLYDGGMISSSHAWYQDVMAEVESAISAVDDRTIEWTTPIVWDESYGPISQLRYRFAQYALYGLPADTYESGDVARQIAKSIAGLPGHGIMMLIPSMPYYGGAEEFFGPTSLTRSINLNQNRAGIHVWTRTGVSSFLPVDEALPFFLRAARLLEGFRPGRTDLLASLDELVESANVDRPEIRLLHLSDLHFGHARADQTSGYLLPELRKLGKIDKIVVTGDLMDSPSPENLARFLDFKNQLIAGFGADCLVVPGNHDARIKGNKLRSVGELTKFLADVGWRRIDWDDDLKMVCFGFDSSREGESARGRVPSEQLRDIASDFNVGMLQKDERKRYLRVGLIHHHLSEMSSVEESSGIIRFYGNVQDRLVAMENAKQILEWCALRGVNLVMHGHKHRFRYQEHNVGVREGMADAVRRVVEVGCGSSTGMGSEGRPISFNLVSWSPSASAWTIEHYVDRGDYSGFFGFSPRSPSGSVSETAPV